jgi:hypothetical protein
MDIRNDSDYELLKESASEVSSALVALSDLEFFDAYGATKIEVRLNTHILEALAAAGDVSGVHTIYTWFEKLLTYGLQIGGSERAEIA